MDHQCGQKHGTMTASKETKNKWLTVIHRAEGDSYPLGELVCRLCPDSHGVVTILGQKGEVALGRGSVLALILEIPVTTQSERQEQGSLVSGLLLALFPVTPKTDAGRRRRREDARLCLLVFVSCFPRESPQLASNLRSSCSTPQMLGF